MSNFSLPAYAQLLYSNGDHRLQFDPVSGYNAYRCRRLPDARVLALGSCTATPPEPAQDAAARALYRHMSTIYTRGDAAWQAFQIDWFDYVRQRLRRLLRLDDFEGLELALAGSGTECEYLASWLALSSAKQPLINVLCGAAEVGAGIRHAAASAPFSRQTPFGSGTNPPPPGKPLPGFPALEVRDISLRDQNGTCLSVQAIDAQVMREVTEQILRGRHVLLHLNAGSKTGIFAPSFACVKALSQTWPDSLSVVVDAAQGRLARREMRSYLERGWLVYLTGSKFYGGPSFSAALLIPPSFPASPRFAPGLADWFCPGELPSSWQHWQRQLPPHVGAGRLLRWEAALAGMAQYYALPKAVRSAICARFAALVHERFSGHAQFQLCMPSSDLTKRSAYPYPTIFPFQVCRPGNNGFLDLSSLSRLRDRLEQGEPQEADASHTRQRFHIGQPVLLNTTDTPDVPQLAVLRLALGAPLIVRLAGDTSLGADLTARFTWLDRQLRQLLSQLALLALQEDSAGLPPQ